MSNWLNRLAHLEEEHHKLDKQIDQMIREGRYEDNSMHDLKKQRLHLRDEIVKLKSQHSKEQND
jgi:hypothetical protein